MPGGLVRLNIGADGHSRQERRTLPYLELVKIAPFYTRSNTKEFLRLQYAAIIEVFWFSLLARREFMVYRNNRRKPLCCFHYFVLLISLVAASTSSPLQALGQSPRVYDSPESAKADPDFAVQGEYVAAGIGLQVIATGDNEFELAIFSGGLPGAGWNGSPPQRIEGDAAEVADLVKKRNLKQIERKSPTLGSPAPSGATVLFDGSKQSVEQHWVDGARSTEDGLLMQGATSRDKFHDYTLHLEFRTPFQPKAKGQGRGNSGIYHQGRYETQILDSFGLEGKNNEAGGIYEIRDPDLNACFPPLSWQTYDIDFTAARFDAAGKKKSDAMLTVRLNSIVVQRDVPVAHPTRAAPLKEEPSSGPIYLQDHGNPVRFRNIWVLPRDAEREALRPIVAGAERFSNDETLAGKILISELGCVACHASQELGLASKYAPILDNVAARVRPDYLLAFINSAHGTKSGTTMPDLFHGQSDAERKRSTEAIASYLATTGKLVDRSGDSSSAQRGEELFHTIGCVACHAPRRGENVLVGTSVPLGDLTAKYTLEGLRSFLLDPLAIRPSGAMPRLVKGTAEAHDIACYLLGEKIIVPGVEQFNATAYYGNFNKLPNFDSLKVAKTGTTIGLDLSIAGRKDNFAIRFDSFLPISVKGKYTFHLGSDDGSRLLIDGNQIVIGDGVHPMELQTGSTELDVGVHSLRIEYFEGGGGEELTLEIEGPKLDRTPINRFVTTDPKGLIREELIESNFKPDPTQVAAGQKLFGSVGCANCHQLKTPSNAATTPLAAKPLKQLRAGQGCLAEKVPTKIPDYALTRSQRTAIGVALKVQAQSMDDKERAHLQMSAKNCYACHTRDSIVGPELARDKLFGTKMQEMGNEGRVPPALTGVGDKLRPEMIDKIISEGAKDRPYMLTRMPAFGKGNLPGLRERLVAMDQKQSPKPTGLPSAQSEAGKEHIVAGRKLTGSSGLSCIKCHRFGDKATPGIQAIDMLTMTERLREDWFHRYMLAPTEYRPGTRMPLSFPDGKSVLTTVFDGDADKQINAMWLYLSLGKDAPKPTGLDTQSIVLAPDTKPVIYRNFIEGIGPRGIAVGYPEQVNLAWDAGDMSLAILWQNEFIDASKHWTGRGEGTQGPLGDLIVRFEKTSPVAKLNSNQATWPTEQARKRGYQFQGYSLNGNGQPTFRYHIAESVEVEDFPRPRGKGANGIGLDRELKIKIGKPTEGLVLMLGSGQIQADKDGGFVLDGRVKIRVTGVKMELVQIGDHQELRAALPKEGELAITQSLTW